MSDKRVGKPAAAAPQQRDALWEWSVFWHSDQLQACLPEDSAVGDQNLQSTWRAFFDALPDGAEVLDLGTGNGGLATQAVAVSRTRATPFSIHGVDLADIAPARFVSSAKDLLAGVVFHGRTSMQALPFADGQFDAVVSQYAIEYTNVESSLTEALRVLKVGGCFRFLVHADDGVLKQRCCLQASQAEHILKSDLFIATESLLHRLVEAETIRTGTKIAEAEEAIAASKAVFDNLEDRFAGDEDRSLVDNLFAAIRTLPGMRRSHSIESLVSMTEEIRLLLLAQSKRLNAMQDAALDIASLTEFASYIKALGGSQLELEQATTGTAANCVGHWLSGTRAAKGMQA